MVLDFAKEALEGYKKPTIEIEWVRQMIKALTFDKVNENFEMKNLDEWLRMHEIRQKIKEDSA